MPIYAWVILIAQLGSTIPIWYLLETSYGRITMNLNDLLTSLQARAQAETDLVTSVTTALSGLHGIIQQLRDELAQAGLSSDQSAKFQAVLDTLDANKAAIAAAVVANTDSGGSDTTSSGGGSDTTSGGDTSTDTTGGGAGDDTISGSGTDDTVGAGSGTDTTQASSGDDTIGASGDTVTGGQGDETTSG